METRGVFYVKAYFKGSVFHETRVWGIRGLRCLVYMEDTETDPVECFELFMSLRVSVLEQWNLPFK